ncbi:MAG TPA: hypothetical protein VEJ86_06505, partial [Candidatus Binataceae bacterium]|nr:hypothetical protein [Candidatus Binataceae bacterium]
MKRISKLRSETILLAVLVLAPVLLNAILLYPEVQSAASSANDDAFHFLFVQRASAALAAGDNPFDFWVPQLAYGFPQFFYYQHLPYLLVVLIHRMLFGEVNLLTLFNLIRYLLLVAFPLTVYWSMRTMEFSASGAAVGAAFASLISPGWATQGFEYESYIFSGFGMFAQLCAMHLLFIWLATVERVLGRASGYLLAILASAALVVSHPFYAYLAGVTAVPAVLVHGLSFRAPESSLAARVRHHLGTLFRMIVRLSIVAACAALITAYFWLPFLLNRAYFNVDYAVYRLSPGLRPFPAAARLHALLRVSWNLLDGSRFPVMSLLAVFGLGCALFTRTIPARLALGIALLWFGLFFFPLIAPALTSVLPLHAALPHQRFIAGVDLGAILLLGVAGEWLWQRFSALDAPWRALAPGLIIVILLAVPLYGRAQRYLVNTSVLESVENGATASNLQSLIAVLKTLPPARAYLPEIGPSLALTCADLQTTYAGQMLSLNSMLQLDRLDPVHCDLFNVRYLILHGHFGVPKFLTLIQDAGEFSLYGAGASSYAEFGSVRWGHLEARGLYDAQHALFDQNENWLHGDGPAAHSFIRWNYPPGSQAESEPAGAGGPDSGTVTEEKFADDRVELKVNCREPATLILRMTY